MKILNSTSGGSRGSALFIALIVTGLVGFVLAAYLSLLGAQNATTMRSQAWNATIPVIEAGVEDALTHLNAHGTSNLLCDGWSQAGNLYWMQRSIGDNYYVVMITNWFGGGSNNSPIIDSRGFISTPILVASSDATLLAQVAGSPSTASAVLGRGVLVCTIKNALFSKGMVAKGQIDLKGNNIASDSFDSSDPNASTGGRYDATKRKGNGDIATDSGVTNSLNVGNANIMGHLSTGPGGSVDIGPNGSVGDTNWVSSGKKGIENSSFVKNDMNVDFKDVPTPTAPTGWFSPASGIVGITPYKYLIPASGYYSMSSLNMSSTDVMRITAGSTVTLYVSGNISMSGQAAIIIDPGASLKLYVGGASASIGGQGVVNSNGTAQSFSYNGLPSNTTLSMGGNAAFAGTIYAPSADLTLGGGGSTTYDFLGASITKTVTMNGHFNFHYDEALAKFGPSSGFIVTSWNEMTPQNISTLPQGVGSRY